MTQLSQLDIFSEIVSCNFITVPQRVQFVFSNDMLEVPIDTSGIILRWSDKFWPLTYFNWGGPHVLVCDAGIPVVNHGFDYTSSVGAEKGIIGINGIPVNSWSIFPVGTL